MSDGEIHRDRETERDRERQREIRPAAKEYISVFVLIDGKKTIRVVCVCARVCA